MTNEKNDMANEHNFKVGDKVYMAYDPTISAIVTDVCHEGKYDYYVKKDGSEFTTGCQEYELLDAKTAFLTRLQSLLREFDAKICGGLSDISEQDVVFILIGGNDKVKYLNGDTDTYAHINADNIMDSDKEGV